MTSSLGLVKYIVLPISAERGRVPRARKNGKAFCNTAFVTFDRDNACHNTVTLWRHRPFLSLLFYSTCPHLHNEISSTSRNRNCFASRYIYNNNTMPFVNIDYDWTQILLQYLQLKFDNNMF